VINLCAAVGRLAKRLQERSQFLGRFTEQIHVVIGGLRRHLEFHHNTPAAQAISAAGSSGRDIMRCLESFLADNSEEQQWKPRREWKT